MKREIDEVTIAVANVKKCKPLSMKTKLIRSWRALMKEPDFEHRFDDGNYILSLKQSMLNSSVIVFLRPGYLKANAVFNIQDVSNFLLQFLDNELSFKQLEKASLQISVTGFCRESDFFTGEIIPDGWFRMDSITRVVYHRGPISVKIEIRGIDCHRDKDNLTPQIFETWSTSFHNIQPTTTAMELKQLVEDNKEKKVFVDGHVVRLDNTGGPVIHLAENRLPTASLPVEMNIIELRPYSYELDFSQFWQNYYQHRIDEIDDNLKPYNEAFPAGDTDWTRPLSKFPQMCDPSGNLMILSYAVAETSVLM